MKKWTLQRHIRMLRKHLPIAGRVSVSVCKLDGFCGDCRATPKGFAIRISEDDPLQSQKETLWHEWAHCMVGWTDKHQHTNAWGKAYAKIYRMIQDEV